MIDLRRSLTVLKPSIAIPFLLLSLIWGSTWLVIKDQLDGAPPGWSVAWRFTIATVAMFAVARLSGQGLKLDRAGQMLALVIGITQFSVNFNLLYEAERHLTSGIVAVIFALLFVPNAAFSRLFLGHAISLRFMVGGLIGIAGITLLLVHEANMAELGGQVGLGLMLSVLSILVVSTANVMQASDAAKRRPFYALLAWGMFWGAVVNTCYALFDAGVPSQLPTSPRYWAGVAYLAILGSVVTFPLYFKLIRELGAGRAAYIGVVIPVVAMALSTLFESYRWSWLAIGGVALALAGTLVALRSDQLSASSSDNRARSPSR